MSDDHANPVRTLSLTFDLSLGATEYLKYYQGRAKWVNVRSTSGATVRLPANRLAPFIGHNGIQGRFVLEYLSTGKFVSICRIRH